MTSSLSLLFSRLNSPSSLSNSSQVLVYQELHCFSLNVFEQINNLAVRGPKLNALFKLSCQWHIKVCHFSSPSGQTISVTDQNAVDHLSTLLVYVLLAVGLYLEVLF